MKVGDRFMISRVVEPVGDRRGLTWITGTGRAWSFPRFGILIGHRWFFPLGVPRR